MKTKIEAWLVAATVLVVLLGVVGCVSISGTKELSKAEVREEADGYVLDFLSGDGTREAHAYLVVGSWDNICTVKLDICHEEDTDVDEISLTFAPMFSDALALQTPGGYPSPLARFERTTDGQGVIYRIPHAGFQGTGTMDFEFYIRKGILESLDMFPEQVRLHVDFTIHKGGTFAKTTQHGEGDIYFQIP
jgi:hypothetical protein